MKLRIWSSKDRVQFILQFVFILLGISQNAISQQYSTDLYSETYSSPFNYNPINFQRITSEYKNEQFYIPQTRLNLIPVISFENSNDLYMSSVTLSGGVRSHLIENLFFDMSLRRESMQQNSLSRWNARTGLVYGKFWQLPLDHLFADAYAELFYGVPELMSPYWTESAWAQVGYRYLSNSSYTLDPLTIGVRNSDNSNPRLVGADYQTFQIGPQASYMFKKSHLTISGKATRAWTSSRTLTAINEFWMLITMGVRF